MPQVTITVDNGHQNDFQKYYLIKRPVPLDDQQEPIMSVGNWIKQGIVQDIFQVLLEGKQMEAFNELEIDIEIS